MNQAVANILKDYIIDLGFVDKIAGLVATQSMTITGEDGVKTIKRYPVACCVTAEDCKLGAYNDLTPDSKYKTVIYFEDGGTSFLSAAGNFRRYQSRLRLVCWINVPKLEGEIWCSEGPCTASTNIIISIIRAIPNFPENFAPLMQVRYEVTNQAVRDSGIFSRYTYNELQTQYLLAPYDYFALDLTVDFAICITGTDEYDASCCT